MIEKINETNNAIRIVAEETLEGLLSAAMLMKALLREGKRFSVTIAKAIDERIMKELSMEDYKICILLGAEGSKVLKGKEVLVFGRTQRGLFRKKEQKDLLEEVYDFVKKLNEKNKDLAHLLIIDWVDKNKKVEEELLEWAKERIEERMGALLFSVQTRPIVEVLKESIDPFIPGITGNEEGTKLLLKNTGIKFKTLPLELNEEEIKKLEMAIILKRFWSEDRNLRGKIYLLKKEEIKDAKEFIVMINACCKFGKPSIVLGLLLENKNTMDEASILLKRYKEEMIKALNWFYSNRKTKNVIEKAGFLIINAENNVSDNLIGSLASVIGKSRLYDNKTVVMTLSHNLAGDIKASIRLIGENDIDLKNLTSSIIKRVEGEWWGNKEACGLIVPQEKEEDFLRVADETLMKYSIEETVK